MQHLDDYTLFSYSDGELAGHELADVRTHLSGCAACQTRLTQLQATLAQVNAVPDLPLQRDLSGAVVAALKASQQPALAPKLSPAATWALALQALLVLVGLGVAVPLGTEFFQGSLAPATLVNWQSLLTQSQTVVATNLAFNWASAWAGLQTFVNNNQVNIQLPALSLTVGLPLLAAVTVLWLVGNGVLLRGSGRLQRR